MAPKLAVPFGWILRANDNSGQLFYCNLKTGAFQLKKPYNSASPETNEGSRLHNKTPRRKKRSKRIKSRHILIKYSQSSHTPQCRVTNEDCQSRSQIDACNLAKVIRLEILSNKYTFEEAALEYSECSTALRGGKMDTNFFKVYTNRILKDVAFSLEVGEMSDPVETITGFHIIQRTA